LRFVSQSETELFHFVVYVPVDNNNNNNSNNIVVHTCPDHSGSLYSLRPGSLETPAPRLYCRRSEQCHIADEWMTGQERSRGGEEKRLIAGWRGLNSNSDQITLRNYGAQY